MDRQAQLESWLVRRDPSLAMTEHRALSPHWSALSVVAILAVPRTCEPSDCVPVGPEQPFANARWKSMKLGQLSEAALYTRDLDAAGRFYHEVLGLEIISRMEGRGISFRCGQTVLLLFDPERTRIPDARVPEHGAWGEGHIAFAVTELELDGWRTHLREHGIAIEAEVEWNDGRRSIYFRDPARNVVELAPPKLWSGSPAASLPEFGRDQRRVMPAEAK